MQTLTLSHDDFSPDGTLKRGGEKGGPDERDLLDGFGYQREGFQSKNFAEKKL
jgi:hypothetical protein